MWNVGSELGRPEGPISNRDNRRTNGSNRALSDNIISQNPPPPPGSPLPPSGLIENPLFDGSSSSGNKNNASSSASGSSAAAGGGGVGSNILTSHNLASAHNLNPGHAPFSNTQALNVGGGVGGARLASTLNTDNTRISSEAGRLSEGARIGSLTAGNRNVHPATVTRQASEPASIGRRVVERQTTVQPRSATLRRAATVKEYVVKGTTCFFGVNNETEENSYQKWTERRKRLLNKRYGKLKESYQHPSAAPPLQSAAPVPHHVADLQACQPLRCSYNPPSVHHQHHHHQQHQQQHHHPQIGGGQSFDTLGGIDEVDRRTSRISGSVASGSRVGASNQSINQQQPNRRKDSVYRLTWDGMVFLSTLAKKRWSTHKTGRPNLPGRQISSYAASEGDDNVFYEDTLDAGLPKAQLPDSEDNFFDRSPWESGSVPSGMIGTTSAPSGMSALSRHPHHAIHHREHDTWYGRAAPPPPQPPPQTPAASAAANASAAPSLLQVPRTATSFAGIAATPPVVGATVTRSEPQVWQRPSSETVDAGRMEIGMKRIWNRVLDRAFENSDRRQYGMGVVGKFNKHRLRRDRLTSQVREQLDDIDDHRPYFTYWVTTVQILITLITLAVYGFGPWGFHRTQRSSLVLVTSLSLQQVDYFEPDNFWLGPRSADLVHLGAKFTPCMRRDRNIFDIITKDREQERNTACCVRNDQSGCVQTSRNKCSEIISTWRKWDPHKPGPPRWISDPKQYNNQSNNHRLSGSVCGQDPRYCEEPASVFPYEWPDDITKWPVCRRTVVGQKASESHMTCEVIGRPCCIGVYGECRITTKEYCDFVKGFFHEEAALCSQVSCLDDVCGMIPFYTPDVPDQFYRLWTSLFLHAGIIHLALTVIVQYLIMRDLEKLVGPIRVAIIYIMSGIAGNLASAIFVPYRAEVGPAGSQFGLLACLLVEVIHCWQMLRRPGMALLRLGAVALVFFLIGTLPWVDNYAHLFGFIFSFLMSYALLPFVSFGTYDRTIKVILIWVCLMVVVALFVALVVLFYVNPIYECSFCKYFNCVPLTHDFCENQDIVFTRLEF